MAKKRGCVPGLGAGSVLSGVNQLGLVGKGVLQRSHPAGAAPGWALAL